MAAQMTAPADVSAVLCLDLALRHSGTSSRPAEARAKKTPIAGTARTGTRNNIRLATILVFVGSRQVVAPTRGHAGRPEGHAMRPMRPPVNSSLDGSGRATGEQPQGASRSSAAPPDRPPPLHGTRPDGQGRSPTARGGAEGADEGARDRVDPPRSGPQVSRPQVAPLRPPARSHPLIPGDMGFRRTPDSLRTDAVGELGQLPEAHAALARAPSGAGRPDDIWRDGAALGDAQAFPELESFRIALTRAQQAASQERCPLPEIRAARDALSSSFTELKQSPQSASGRLPDSLEGDYASVWSRLRGARRAPAAIATFDKARQELTAFLSAASSDPAPAALAL